MGAKRRWWAVVLLAVSLAVTGCGNSVEVEAAKAEYIRAKAHLIEAEAQTVEQEAASLEQQRELAAQRAEQEAALLQQQRELARANAELAAERSRERQQAFIETSQVVITGGLSVGSLLVLLHALRPLIRTWTEQRMRRLQAETQLLNQRIRWAELEKSRLKHERVLLEAQARAKEERQETLRLQAQLAQAHAQLAREKRWLEHTHRTQVVPLEHETAGGNGHGH